MNTLMQEMLAEAQAKLTEKLPGVKVVRTLTDGTKVVCSITRVNRRQPRQACCFGKHYVTGTTTRTTWLLNEKRCARREIEALVNRVQAATAVALR